MSSRRNLILGALAALLIFFKYRSVRKFIQAMLFRRQAVRTLPWIDDTTHGGLIAAHVLKVRLFFFSLLSLLPQVTL
jgi:hypothetical protein